MLHMAAACTVLKRVAANRTIKTKPLVLSHGKNGYEMLMFPDASDPRWDGFLTDVPSDMDHEPRRRNGGHGS